jgi:hypothetical protein
MTTSESGSAVRDDRSPTPGSYERPALEVLGSVHSLTQQDKKYGASDGYTFMGVNITNNSR